MDPLRPAVLLEHRREPTFRMPLTKPLPPLSSIRRPELSAHDIQITPFAQSRPHIMVMMVSFGGSVVAYRARWAADAGVVEAERVAGIGGGHGSLLGQSHFARLLDSV